MSVILDGLKRAQQIRMEKRQKGEGFGPNLPWFSFWSKRWFTLQRLLCLLGSVLALILFFTFYKPWADKPLPQVSRPSPGHLVISPTSRNTPDRLEEDFVDVALEEVRRAPSPKAFPLRGEAEVGTKAGAVPKTAPPATKSVAPVQERPADEPVRIQPIPSQKAINHFNLGLLYHKKNELHKAVEEYNEALELDPFDVQAHNNLGMVYSALGRLPDAISQYQKALFINPNYAKAHHNLAVAYYLNGDLEKAILEFKLALDSDPKNPEIYNNLGLIYRRQKQGERAKKVFQRGLSIVPDYAPIHYNLALTLEDEGDWKGAVRHYRKFAELAPEHQRKLVEKVKDHLKTISFHEKYEKK